MCVVIEIFRCRLDGFGHVSEDVRVTHVHADAQVGVLETVLENLDQAGAVERLLPMTSSATLTPTASAIPWISSMLRMADSRWLSSGPGCWATGHAEMYDEELERDRLRDVQRGRHLVQRRLPRIVVAKGSGEVALRLAVCEHVRDRRVDGMQIEPCLGQPVPQRANRRLVVVVEVASRGEHLDGLEAMCGDLEEMGLLQPLFVIQVSGDAKFLHDALTRT